MTGIPNTSFTASHEALAASEAADRHPIVKMVEGEALADSRDVAAYFRKEHKRVLQTIREMHCSADFRRHNFVPFKINDLTGETTSHVMMTKDGFSFLVMGFTGATAAVFKESYIQAFNTMEAELRAGPFRDPTEVLNDPAAMRGILLTYTEKVRALEGQVGEMQPAGEALDRSAVSDGSMCITDAAKNLQIRPSDLFKYLRSHGWIYRRPGTDHDIAYQSKLVAGLMEHKTTTVLRSDGSEKVTTQVRLTGKGITVLAKLLGPSLQQVA